MLYAKFMYPNNGYDYDVNYSRNVGLKIGEKYEVSELDMGQSHTSVCLKGIQGCFNSVQFEFEESNEPVDIYNTPKYNPYL